MYSNIGLSFHETVPLTTYLVLVEMHKNWKKKKLKIDDSPHCRMLGSGHTTRPVDLSLFTVPVVHIVERTSHMESPWYRKGYRGFPVWSGPPDYPTKNLPGTKYHLSLVEIGKKTKKKKNWKNPRQSGAYGTLANQSYPEQNRVVQISQILTI